jgi:hypothetical protein
MNGVYRSSTLSPPSELIQRKECVVIVSVKRPVIVYFEKAMEMVAEKILTPLPPGISIPPVSIEIVGTGAAIQRCEQVSRYVVQEINSKFKHMIKSVEKRKSKSVIEISDLHVGNDLDDECAIFEMTSEKRSVNRISIQIDIFR